MSIKFLVNGEEIGCFPDNALCDSDNILDIEVNGNMYSTTKTALKQSILDEVFALGNKFIYYDRFKDDKICLGIIEYAIINKIISIGDIIDRFSVFMGMFEKEILDKFSED